MSTWLNMVSCSDAEFNELHEMLRNGRGCLIFDNVTLPETFNNHVCTIEFRYYSERRITLTVLPKPAVYNGKNRGIKRWAENGYAEFSGFIDLKIFLKSFRNDRLNENPSADRAPTGRLPAEQAPNRNPRINRPVAAPPQPRTNYNRDAIQVPETNRPYLLVDKNTLCIALKEEIYGQDEQIEKIVHLICNHLSTKCRSRPLCVFLYGPTGTGKSAVVETAVERINKQLDENHRLAYRPVDCTQFQERADISRLTGAAPGYVGFDEPGVFSILEQNPYTVFVFEEIEKAANNVTEVIMQAMETGKQETNGKTLKNGRSYYDLSNSVIFFTSNIIIDEKKKNIGFANEDPAPPLQVAAAPTEANIARKIGAETKEAKLKLAESGKFRREVISRMQAIIKFNPLSGDTVKDIAAKCIRDTAAKQHLLYITELDTPILQEFINATAGQVESFGARSLRNEAGYYFDDAFREYSHSHADYAHIKVAGTLDNIVISPT